MVFPQLLELLRDWWHAARPQVWIFPGQNPINPMTPRQLNRAVPPPLLYCRGAAMARRPRSGKFCRFPTITSSSPCRLRSAPSAFQNKAAVYDLLFRDRRRDAHRHGRRPQASGRAHRPHRRAAHLGLGADPSSARPRHRSRRRPFSGRQTLGHLQVRLLPTRARVVAPLSPPLSRRTRGLA